jgi:hypothetical protein
MIRKAVVADALALAPRLRQADRDELYAAGHDDVVGILKESVTTSVEAYAFEVDGVVETLFGIAKAGFMGVPWLLGSDALFGLRKALCVYPLEYIPRWRGEYSMLGNLVHVDNARSIRWLKHLGFTIHPPVDHARGRFHPFTMSTTYV